MKEFLIIWIIFQSAMIGSVWVSVENEVLDGTYDCNWKKVSPWKGGLAIGIVPLSLFVEKSNRVKDYCDNQLNQ